MLFGCRPTDLNPFITKPTEIELYPLMTPALYGKPRFVVERDIDAVKASSVKVY
jgi:hypothetical protein